MIKSQFLKNMSRSELIKIAVELNTLKNTLMALLPENNAMPIIGDKRTSSVKMGDYSTRYKGETYLMESFIGIVKKIKYVSKDRARIVAIFKNGINLSFFAYIDSTIKVNTLIECVGIVLKNGRFYDFKCKGECRRYISNDEIKQLIQKKSFENVELNDIPWDIISTIHETPPIDSSYAL